MKTIRLASMFAVTSLTASGLFACAAAPADDEGAAEEVASVEQSMLACRSSFEYENVPVKVSITKYPTCVASGGETYVNCAPYTVVETQYQKVYCANTCISSKLNCHFYDNAGVRHSTTIPTRDPSSEFQSPCNGKNMCGNIGGPVYVP
jgi:hypothetical protein